MSPGSSVLLDLKVMLRGLLEGCGSKDGQHVKNKEPKRNTASMRAFS
jgi:hypothetical protein